MRNKDVVEHLSEQGFQGYIDTMNFMLDFIENGTEEKFSLEDLYNVVNDNVFHYDLSFDQARQKLDTMLKELNDEEDFANATYKEGGLVALTLAAYGLQRRNQIDGLSAMTNAFDFLKDLFNMSIQNRK